MGADTSWLEVIEANRAGRRGVLTDTRAWFVGMRVALEGEVAALAARHQLIVLPGVKLMRDMVGRWVATAAPHHSRHSANVSGARLDFGLGKTLVDGDEICSDDVILRYREGPADHVLGCAWRLGDRLVFPGSFLPMRWYRGLALHEPMRFVGLAVVSPHSESTEGVIARSPSANVVELPDIHGPSLAAILARSDPGVLDGGFLEAICQDVVGAVGRIEDVVVRFDGAVVSSSTRVDHEPPGRQRLRLRLQARGLQLSQERVDRAALAGLVRALFPDNAAQHDALLEEVQLLNADAWRARVPAVTRDAPTIR